MGNEAAYNQEDLSDAPPRAFSASSARHELLWALIDAGPDALVVVDDRGMIDFVNAKTEAMFGYGRGELVGRSIETLVPDGARAIHRMHRARYGDRPVHRPVGALGSPLLARRADGRGFPVDISLSPVDSAGRRWVVAAVRDVSDRLEAERHARAIRHAIDTAVDAIYIVDDQTLEFTYVNERAAVMHGYTIDEMIGRTPLDLAPDLDRGHLEDLVGPLVTGELDAVTLQTAAVRKDGVRFPVEVHINHPPRIDEDTGRSFVAVVQDITDRIQTERELANAKALTRVVDERGRLARDLHDRVIGQLFGLGLGLQAGAARSSDPAQALLLQDTVTALDDVISQLRSTIFDLQNHPSTANARRYLRHEAERFRDRLGHEPRVSFSGPVDELPDHLIDEVGVVLNEALTNVVKHADATATTIDIHCLDDATLVVKVADNGDGLPPQGPHRSGGLGSVNLANRARDLGGRCCIEGGARGGTTVTWTVPVPLRTPEAGCRARTSPDRTGTRGSRSPTGGVGDR